MTVNAMRNEIFTGLTHVFIGKESAVALSTYYLWFITIALLTVIYCKVAVQASLSKVIDEISSLAF